MNILPSQTKKIGFWLLLFLGPSSWLFGQVNYQLTYDSTTKTYTVGIISANNYSGGLARLTSSTQVSIVVPHTAGGYQVTDLINLQTGGTSLDWGHTSVNAPSENTTKDYLFFTPNNTTFYTPFDIPANTLIDLFSFKSGSGCLGVLTLFNNDTDPLNSNLNLNPINNIVIVGAGNTNLYNGNTGTTANCLDDCTVNAAVLSY